MKLHEFLGMDETTYHIKFDKCLAEFWHAYLKCETFSELIPFLDKWLNDKEDRYIKLIVIAKTIEALIEEDNPSDVILEGLLRGIKLGVIEVKKDDGESSDDR